MARSEELIAKHRIRVFSSNHALYGDMSRRVNEVLGRFSPEAEVYSVDETFLDFGGLPCRDLWAYAQDLRATVRRWTGIPTCVGIGPTKTLAKLANAVAKKNPTFGGACDLTQPEVRAAVLRAFPAGDVWGIGPATARKLAGVGVATAAGLRGLDARLARGLGTVVLERFVRELNGLPCLELETDPPARKGLAVTRSFGVPLTELAPVREAVAAHATRAGEKLRAQGPVAGHLAAFVHTPLHGDGPRRHAARATRLAPPTGDTRELVAAAVRCLEAAWRDGFSYVKAGVLLDDLCPPEMAPPDLFAGPRPGSAALMAAVDAPNARYGRGTVFPAAAGVERAWAQQAAHRSARATTRVNEVPVARA